MSEPVRDAYTLNSPGIPDCSVSNHSEIPNGSPPTHVWAWNKYPTAAGSWVPGNRAGQPVVLLAAGRRNTVLVEWPDGERMTTSRYGLRRIAS